MTQKQPLTNINGNPVYKGDYIYSTYHNSYDIVAGLIHDDRGIAYLVFENIGQVSLAYCKVFH